MPPRPVAIGPGPLDPGFQAKVSRRTVLGAPLALAACMDGPPPRTDFPAPNYEFLTPLRLNIAEIEVRDATQPAPGDLSGQAPVPPVQALRQMAMDRVKPGGSSGRAVFVINEASVGLAAGGVGGSMAVELDILAADGRRAAFAEARVQRRRSGSRDDVRGALYDLVRDMMDDMNVEFEFQVRRSLRDWLQTATTAPAPAAVEQQDLAPPPGLRSAP